jgi:hypothetical protein
MELKNKKDNKKGGICDIKSFEIGSIIKKGLSLKIVSNNELSYANNLYYIRLFR